MSDSSCDSSCDLVLRGAHLVRLVDGKTVAQVSATELHYQRDGGRYRADQVHATLLPGSPARALDSFGAVQITAPTVSGDGSTTEASGAGGVTAQAARGDTARGEKIVYDGKRRLLRSERPIAIAGSGYTLRGGGLEATTDGERFELTQGAGGTLSPKPAGKGAP